MEKRETFVYAMDRAFCASKRFLWRDWGFGATARIAITHKKQERILGAPIARRECMQWLRPHLLFWGGLRHG